MSYHNYEGKCLPRSRKYRTLQKFRATVYVTYDLNRRIYPTRRYDRTLNAFGQLTNALCARTRHLLHSTERSSVIRYNLNDKNINGIQRIIA